MPDTAERIYRRGLLPLDPVKHARFKTAADYGYTLPSPTYPIDRTEGITAWGIDGNGPDPTLTVNNGQPVGDCGPCAVPAHSGMLTAVLTGLPLAANTMTSDQVVDLYFSYTGGQDTGVDIGDWLLWLYQQGLIEGFLKLELAEMDAALATFDVVITGVDLNPDADGQFSDGQPWDVGPGDEPDPDDGHAILYLVAQSASGPYAWCTWGAIQPSTLAWKQGCVTQAFAVLTRQQAEGVGFPFAALDADLKALGGTVVVPAPTPPPPAPTPAPTPPAPPQPTPVPAPPEPTPAPVPDPSIIKEIEQDIEDAVEEVAEEGEKIIEDVRRYVDGNPVDEKGRPLGVPWAGNQDGSVLDESVG